jgi:hypothetical protein
LYRPDIPYSELQLGGKVVAMGLDNSYTSSSSGPINFVPFRVNGDGGLVCSLSGTTVEITSSITDVEVVNLPGTFLTCSVLNGSSTLQGVVTASFLSSSTDATTRNVNVDKYGLIHTYNEAGISTLPADYVSPVDFSASYGTAITLNISGAPFTVNDTNCSVSYILYRPASGYWTMLVNGANGYSINASFDNVITASHPLNTNIFAASDVGYRVGIRYQNKAFTLGTNSQRVEEINPLSQQVAEEVWNNGTNQAAGTSYFPSSNGMAMLGYKNLSLTGKFINSDGFVTGTIEVTNDPLATADWIAILGYRTDVGVMSGTIYCSGSTTTYAWDFDNINYKYVRAQISCSDNTNTVILNARRSY